MNAESLASRVVISGFEGESIPPEIARAAAVGDLGGLVLFSRNVRDHQQVAELVASVTSLCPTGAGPIVAVDQEGGRVVRLRDPLTVLPSARSLAELGDSEITRRAGLLVGLELASLGFTLNLAPVLDVDSNPASPVIGDRSYGADSDTVVRHGFAFARGLRDGGVHPCAKHFPGHGDATVDSHLDLPMVEHDRARLEQVEIEPFAAWAKTGLGAAMIAHVLYPALDPERPATTSRVIVTDLLRRSLRFSKAILSDDLEMGAIAKMGGAAAAAVQAIDAGIDGLLVCRRVETRAAVVEALARAATDRLGFARRLELAGGRLASLRAMPLVTPGRGWIGGTDHARMKEALLRDLRGVS